MRTADIAELRGLGLFSAMAEPCFEALLRAAYVQTFPAGMDLFNEGDPADFLHIVLEGSVSLLAGWNGRETVMATVRPVATFILAATIRDAPYLMSARTSEKSRVALVPSGDVRRAFAQDADFARAIVDDLALCYRSVVKHVKDLKLRSSTERLANYLLRQSNRQGGLEFDLTAEKRAIASYLGMTPENMSRAIKLLRSYGVEVDGQQVRIVDRADLERFGKPTPQIDDPLH